MAPVQAGRFDSVSRIISANVTIPLTPGLDNNTILVGSELFRRWQLLGGIMLAMFLASLDQTIVSTALPKIVGDLGGFDRFTWVTTAYIVASTSVVPIAGSLADVFGRKRLYVFGISVFLVGPAMAGTSQSMNALIRFRAVQGVGGGIMMALSIVTIGDLFPPK